MTDLRSLARQLGGDVAGRNTVNCPGPGHSPRDRSLSVTFDRGAPDGFLVNSFAGDDPISCKDHVRHLLGLDRWQAKRRLADEYDAAQERGEIRTRADNQHVPDENKLRVSEVGLSHKDIHEAREIRDADPRALQIWSEATLIRDTPAETYLRSRGFGDLEWICDVRFHHHCPFGPGERHPCMVALYRDIITNEPKAIHRTALTTDGQKIGRKVLGPKARCAIKISDNADVDVRLSIGEGIETALAGAELLYRPVWALSDANGIAKFPVLPGIESLTIFVDNDVSGAGQKAARECSARWTGAGREVFRVVPNNKGDDLCDVRRRMVAA